MSKSQLNSLQQLAFMSHAWCYRTYINSVCCNISPIPCCVSLCMCRAFLAAYYKDAVRRRVVRVNDHTDFFVAHFQHQSCCNIALRYQSCNFVKMDICSIASRWWGTSVPVRRAASGQGAWRAHQEGRQGETEKNGEAELWLRVYRGTSEW